MAAAGLRSRFRNARDRCVCLFSPTRSSAAMKVMVVVLHAIYIGGLVALDSNFIRKMIEQTWISVSYMVVLVACLFQYFFTSGSSPGYVIDAMRAGNETHATFTRDPMQSASRNGSFISSTDASLLERGTSRKNSSSWLKLVMDLYPPGSSSRNWSCSYCNIIQPPRSRHCHDCDKCVLQFDHHCVWLGTCIGLRNHCRFWFQLHEYSGFVHISIVMLWIAILLCLESYIFHFVRFLLKQYKKRLGLHCVGRWFVFEESILCVWTIVYYIVFLRSDTGKEWWQDVIAVFFLATLFFCGIFLLLLLLFHSYLVVTNQTTYELVRRRRILYLRGISPRVHPFSKGICNNIYIFCCVPKSFDTLETVPTVEELEAMARPYTCLDILSCRCC